MKKNPQFSTLLNLSEERCNGATNIVAKGSQEALHYTPRTNTFLYEYNRGNKLSPTSSGSILQSPNDPCPFTFHIHEYNNQPPYLEINLGNITSILHFVNESENSNN